MEGTKNGHGRARAVGGTASHLRLPLLTFSHLCALCVLCGECLFFSAVSFSFFTYPARTRTWNRGTKNPCVANYTTG